jgi:hypothetical protein
MMRRILMRGSVINEPGRNRRKLASDHIAMILEPQAVADLMLEFAG